MLSNIYLFENAERTSGNNIIVPSIVFILALIYLSIIILFFFGYIKYPVSKVILYPYIPLTVYMFLCIYVFVNQAEMIFMPKHSNAKNLEFLSAAYKDFKKISLGSGEDKFEGYFLPRYSSGTNDQIKPLILYFGGNAEEVSSFFMKAEKIPDYSIISFNYRGYGESLGLPNIKMKEDALNIYKYVKSSFPDIPIIIVGRSIGTAFSSIAYNYAKDSRLILITPFDKFINLAKENYPFLPTWLILRYRFDNISNTRFGKGRILVSIAEKDEVINPKYAKNLFDNILAPKKLSLIKGFGHNNIYESEEFWKEFNLFLKS